MIAEDTEIKNIWGTKENVNVLLEHGIPVEFYCASDPKYLGRVKIVNSNVLIYKFGYQDGVTNNVENCMDSIVQVPSEEFIWDFLRNQLVFDFKTKQKSNSFSIFPRFQDNAHYTSIFAILPDYYMYLASDSSQLSSALFAVHFMSLLNCSITSRFEGVENTVHLIESVYGLPKSDLFTYGWDELKGLMPKIPMKSEPKIPKELLETFYQNYKENKESKKEYLISDIIKTGKIPNTPEIENVIIDDNVFSIESAYLFEGILYLKVPDLLDEVDLSIIMDSIGLDDEKIMFVTEELKESLLKDIDDDDEDNWRY